MPNTKPLLGPCDSKPLPEPWYGCAYCADTYSWPASDLFWSEKTKSWICDNCWDEVEEHWVDDLTEVERGITLADELKNRGINR